MDRYLSVMTIRESDLGGDFSGFVHGARLEERILIDATSSLVVDQRLRHDNLNIEIDKTRSE